MNQANAVNVEKAARALMAKRRALATPENFELAKLVVRSARKGSLKRPAVGACGPLLLLNADWAYEKLLRDEEARRAFESVFRLGGANGPARTTIRDLARDPPPLLTSGQKATRREERATFEVSKRAQRALKKLDQATDTVEKCVVALDRAEKRRREAAAQVRYYQKTGALPPAETEDS